jgi:HSP20 family protein
MTMRRWDPWSEMMTLREAMNRLLEDSYVHPQGGNTPSTANTLLLDVYEDADNVEVEASLPGLRPEDVEITVQGDVLVIKGQRKNSAERKQGNYLMREQRSGTFYRAIQLPVNVDADKSHANFEHGVLRLTLPKAASTKPRQIPIHSTGNQPIPQQIGNGHSEPAPVPASAQGEGGETK